MATALVGLIRSFIVWFSSFLVVVGVSSVPWVCPGPFLVLVSGLVVCTGACVVLVLPCSGMFPHLPVWFPFRSSLVVPFVLLLLLQVVCSAVLRGHLNVGVLLLLPRLCGANLHLFHGPTCVKLHD